MTSSVRESCLLHTGTLGAGVSWCRAIKQSGPGSVWLTATNSHTLSPMPSDVALKAMNRVHRVLLGASGGRLGWRFSGMPVIELTTTGRKSGQPRTTMLTSPYQEDSTFVVVASRGGDDTNPAWFLNLRDDPKVMVKLGPKPRRR